MMNKIKQLIYKIKGFFFAYKMKLFIEEAERRKNETGKRQYIVKIHNTIVIIDKKWFKQQKQNGVLPRIMTQEHLRKIAYYYTK